MTKEERISKAEQALVQAEIVAAKSATTTAKDWLAIADAWRELESERSTPPYGEIQR